MSNKREITPAQMRLELKAMGYSVRVKHYSAFSSATISKNGETVTGSDIFTAEFLEKHKAFFDWKNSVSVIEDGWRIIL